MRVLLLTSHAIAEYDDLRMLTDLGYEVFSIGGAYDDIPFEGKRPALDVKRYPELVEACHRQRADMEALWGGPGDKIDWAKAVLADDVLDWAEVIIVHHFPEHWILDAWDRIKTKRVVWRTCGQSSPDGSLERLMGPLRAHGLQIVRYSPREAFLPDYAGHDALIRFGKYPDDYGPWRGDNAVVGNVTQHMAQRGDACGYGFWVAATQGLPAQPVGPGSEVLAGGIGQLDYYGMLDYLAGLRAYLYTGTNPASYTLGLMEAMLSGVPTMSIPAHLFGAPELFEGVDITGWAGAIAGARTPVSHEQAASNTKVMLNDWLEGRMGVEQASVKTRQRAIELFDVAHVGPQWKAFLG